MAGRQQQDGAGLVVSGGNVVHPQLAPFTDGFADLGIGQGVIEAAGQGHFNAPGLTALPAGFLQVVRRRGQGVGGTVPDIAAAVAVEVHGKLVVGAGDKLGLAHGAGPGATHAAGLHVAMLENAQRREQLFVGKRWAAAFIGQGGEGGDHRLVAHVLAEVAFHAPDRHQCVAVDAVALLDGLQGAGVFGQQRLATAHAGGRDGAVEVFPHRPGEFRLAAVGPDDRWVRAYACKGRIKHRGLDTGAQGFLAKGRLPAGEALGRLLESGSTGGAEGGRGQANGGALHDGCRGFNLARGMVVGTGGQQAQAGAEKGAAQQGWVKHVHVSKACVRALTLTC